MACSCLPSPKQGSLRMCGVIPPLCLPSWRAEGRHCLLLPSQNRCISTGRQKKKKQKGDGKVTCVFSRQREREHLSPTEKRRNTFRNQNTRWPCLDEPHVDFNSWQCIVLYSQWLLPVVLLMREYGYKLGPPAAEVRQVVDSLMTMKYNTVSVNIELIVNTGTPVQNTVPIESLLLMFCISFIPETAGLVLQLVFIPYWNKVRRGDMLHCVAVFQFFIKIIVCSCHDIPMFVT